MKSTTNSKLARLAGPLLIAAALLGTALTASAAAYIKFDGVDGESKDRTHERWCDLLSFGQTIHRPLVEDSATAGASRRCGDVILEDIVVVKELDKASPKLAESICRGLVFPRVEIELTRSYDPGDGTGQRVTYLKYELKNVMVTSYRVSGKADEVPQEEFSLNYEEIKVTYTEIDERGASKGKIEYSWNVEEGIR